MPRPKGSKNKPKDNGAAAAQAPGPGHNGPAEPLTDDQLAKRFFVHVREYKAELALKKECDDAKREQDAVFKNLCKRIKGEGTPIEEIKDHLELQTSEGEARMRLRIDAQLRVARWNGLPLGTQSDLFAGAVDRTPAVDRAHAEGKAAGMEGLDRSTCPYGAPGEQFERWNDGYQFGQGVKLEEGIKPIPSDDGDDEWSQADPSRVRTEGGDAPGSYVEH